MLSRRATPFAPGVTQYVVSRDGKKLRWRSGGQQPTLAIVDTDEPPPAAVHGRLATSIRMLVDPRAECRPMFDEKWRKRRE